MKNLCYGLGSLILVITSCETETKAPVEVQQSLEKKYPGISKVQWDLEKDGSWEAEFVKNGVKTAVTFLSDGSLKETEEELSWSNFPSNAQAYIKKEYPNKKIEDYTKISDSKGIITYEAEVDDKDIIFDVEGHFLKNEIETIQENNYGISTPKK
jgi:hypothetical protein